VGLIEETWGGGKEEDNNREWVILKYTTAVYEQDTTKCTEKCSTNRVGRKV
jgi:hypothetical protein